MYIFKIAIERLEVRKVKTIINLIGSNVNVIHRHMMSRVLMQCDVVVAINGIVVSFGKNSEHDTRHGVEWAALLIQDEISI